MHEGNKVAIQRYGLHFMQCSTRSEIVVVADLTNGELKVLESLLNTFHPYFSLSEIQLSNSPSLFHAQSNLT